MFSQSLNTEFEPAYEVYIDKTQKPVEKVVCLRCGRPLTNEKSRLAQIGPKCARRLFYELRTRSYSTKTLKCQKIISTSPIQRQCIPTKQISLYYIQGSVQKPLCKLGILTLSSLDSNTADNHSYYKRSYCLPLFEGITYEVLELLPHLRMFRLQVQNQLLIDISDL